jgi:hypothetical protein
MGRHASPPAGLPPRPSGWAGRPLSRLGLIRCAPGRPSSLHPGWAGLLPSGQDSSSRPGSLPRPHCAGWAGLTLQDRFPLYPGWARPGFPLPRPRFLLAGRITPSQAGILLFWPRFTPFGTYSSSGIDSSALCQSWDTSRLGLAHPPSLYAGLGTPLGSDQHTPPLLVSLILRRRIRLMTWRS